MIVRQVAKLMDKSLQRHVRSRAGNLCEYCGIHHINGLTPIGRTTVRVLVMNHTDAVALREALIEEQRK